MLPDWLIIIGAVIGVIVGWIVVAHVLDPREW